MSRKAQYDYSALIGDREPYQSMERKELRPE